MIDISTELEDIQAQIAEMRRLAKTAAPAEAEAIGRMADQLEQQARAIDQTT